MLRKLEDCSKNTNQANRKLEEGKTANQVNSANGTDTRGKGSPSVNKPTPPPQK